MELSVLETRLSLLKPGQAELLSATQFDLAFANLPSFEEQKAEASRVADRHGCEVRFIGDRDGFAVFTRMGERGDRARRAGAHPA